MWAIWHCDGWDWLELANGPIDIQGETATLRFDMQGDRLRAYILSGEGITKPFTAAPHWGFTARSFPRSLGAGLATFISNCAACAYFFVLLFVKRGKTYVCVNPSKLGFILNVLFPLYGLAYAQFTAEVVLAVAAVIVLWRLINKLEKRKEQI